MTVVTRSGWRARKLIVFLVAVAVGTGLFFYLKNNVSVEELVEHEVRLRETIAQHPVRAFALGLALYTVVSLVPGTSGKSVIFGWLYGFWQGVVLILSSLTLAALAIFFLSRYVFRAAIEHRYGRFLGTLNRHLEREGAFYLLALRMAHFPYSILNPASGASRVRATTFAWTTMLGLTPGTMVFAYVGNRLPSLEVLTAQGPGSLVDGPLIAALAVSAVFPFVFRWAARRLGLFKDGGNGPGSTVREELELTEP